MTDWCYQKNAVSAIEYKEKNALCAFFSGKQKENDD